MRRLITGMAVVGMLVGVGQAATIDIVTVDNPRNANDTHGDGYGGVGHTYNIGKYEVTAGQYTEFLNAVAADDAYGLYSTSMWSEEFGCRIERKGSSGSYAYSVGIEWAYRPVNYVSWGDAVRFANWLHNDQPTGAQGLTTTEDGAYYLTGATSDGALVAVDREPDWKWAIPTEDEWYKAAYHKNDGPTANYFDYPTGSDTTPSNDLPLSDPGNNATFFASGHTIGVPYYRTIIGAHENSESPYGTFDQAGNVSEWNETLIGSSRGLRGGSFPYNALPLRASDRYDSVPTDERFSVGFRVASFVPEPGSIAMLAGLAAMGLLYWRRKK